jgi:hypothetical protein
VQGNARLASGGLAEEIKRLRAGPGEGDIAIGGATLAAEAAALVLFDEYRARVYPVLVGGGIPFFPQRERRVDLELVESRTFSSRVVYLRYRVARWRRKAEFSRPGPTQRTVGTVRLPCECRYRRRPVLHRDVAPCAKIPSLAHPPRCRRRCPGRSRSAPEFERGAMALSGRRR